MEGRKNVDGQKIDASCARGLASLSLSLSLSLSVSLSFYFEEEAASVDADTVRSTGQSEYSPT